MQPAVELSSFPLKSLGINAVSSSRVCCEAGSLVAMGDSFAGLATSNKRKNLTISSTDPPKKNVSNYRLTVYMEQRSSSTINEDASAG